MKEISWNSTPEYDGWGPSPNVWNGIDWMNWHIALRNHYSKDQADQIWCRAWLEGVSTLGGGYGTAPGSGTMMDSVPIDDRTLNSAFRNYLNASGNEMLYASVFTGVGGAIGEGLSTAVGAVGDTVNAVGDIVRNTASGASTASKVLKTALPLLLILLLLGGTVYVSKKAKLI